MGREAAVTGALQGAFDHGVAATGYGKDRAILHHRAASLCFDCPFGEAGCNIELGQSAGGLADQIGQALDSLAKPLKNLDFHRQGAPAGAGDARFPTGQPTG